AAAARSADHAAADADVGHAFADALADPVRIGPAAAAVHEPAADAADAAGAVHAVQPDHAAATTAARTDAVVGVVRRWCARRRARCRRGDLVRGTRRAAGSLRAGRAGPGSEADPDADGGADSAEAGANPRALRVRTERRRDLRVEC